MLMLTQTEHPGGSTARFWQVLRDGQLVLELEENLPTTYPATRQTQPGFASLNVWAPGADMPEGVLAFEMERCSWEFRGPSLYQTHGCFLSLLLAVIKSVEAEEAGVRG